MRILRINVNESIYHNLLWFLKRFGKDELQVIDEGDELLSVQSYLDNELQKVEEGSAEYMSLKELSVETEKTIRKHED